MYTCITLDGGRMYTCILLYPKEAVRSSEHSNEIFIVYSSHSSNVANQRAHLSAYSWAKANYPNYTSVIITRDNVPNMSRKDVELLLTMYRPKKVCSYEFRGYDDSERSSLLSSKLFTEKEYVPVFWYILGELGKYVYSPIECDVLGEIQARLEDLSNVYSNYHLYYVAVTNTLLQSGTTHTKIYVGEYGHPTITRADHFWCIERTEHGSILVVQIQ